MNFRTRILGSLITLLSAASSPALACRCGPPPSTDTAYRRAHTVVEARVARVVSNNDNKIGSATASIIVSQAWKKDIPAQVDVTTSTTCAFDFSEGESYLLFLYDDEAKMSYWTSQCTGNQKVKDAHRAIDWLKRHGAPSTVR